MSEFSGKSREFLCLLLVSGRYYVKKDSHQDKIALEMLMDKHSLKIVLEAISEICFEKADHVQSVWQDGKLARAWRTCGKFMDTISSIATINRVS